MALQINDVSTGRGADRGRFPDMRLVIKDVVADGAYPTGGYPVTPAMFGLTAIFAIVPAPTPDGAHVSYDAAAGKLKYLVSAASGSKFAEPGAAVVSGSTSRLLVFGT